MITHCNKMDEAILNLTDETEQLVNRRFGAESTDGWCDTAGLALGQEVRESVREATAEVRSEYEPRLHTHTEALREAAPVLEEARRLLDRTRNTE